MLLDHDNLPCAWCGKIRSEHGPAGESPLGSPADQLCPNTGVSSQFYVPQYEEFTAVTILCRNHRGEISLRRIQPLHLWFGTTPHHVEEQWLLDVYDYSKSRIRTFAWTDILHVEKPLGKDKKAEIISAASPRRIDTPIETRERRPPRTSTGSIETVE